MRSDPHGPLECCPEVATAGEAAICEIAGRTGLSRNMIKTYLNSEAIEPSCATPDRPSGLIKDHEMEAGQTFADLPGLSLAFFCSSTLTSSMVEKKRTLRR